MDWWLITFFLGALLSLFLPTVPTIFCVVLLLVLACLIFWFTKTRKYTGLFVGAAWLLYHGVLYQEAKQRHSPSAITPIRQAIIIKGVITSIPQLKNNTQRFNFSLSHINNKLIQKDNKARLSWKSDKHIYFNNLSQGQKWQFKVRLKPAHGLANTGGFSYQTWLRKNNLVATGYVINAKSTNKAKTKAKTTEKVVKQYGINILLENTETFRQKLYQKVTKLLPQHNLSPVVLALTFGERSQLTKDHWHVLKNTATQHLIAISGLHLGLVTGGAYLFFSWLMKVLPLNILLSYKQQQNILRFNHQISVIFFTLLFALFYSYLAGFSVPTSRALLMILLHWTARGLGIKLSATRLILITVFFIILFSPFSLFSNSFWLSLYAVSIIFLLLWRFRTNFSKKHIGKKQWINKGRQWLISLFYLQIGLIFLMIPITVQFNHQLTLMALPANLIAVPWMSFTAIPLSLLAVVFAPISDAMSTFFIEASLVSLTLLWQYLTWLSEFSLANINVSFSDWLFLLGFALFIILYVFIGLSRRTLGILALPCTVLATMSFINDNEKASSDRTWQVSVMDVGQGLSVIVEVKNRETKQTENKVLIYDTGATFPSGFSMAEAVITPYLINQGYQAIDKLIISHDDNDHAGGLSLLTDNFSVEQVIFNGNKQFSPCLAGNKMNWQGLTIEFLWPNLPIAQHNDDSCVIKISDGQRSVLLTGDISKKIEQRLIKQSNSNIGNVIVNLQADILVVPHHGSKTSSSPAFIEHVSPQYAVFSAGYLNRWKMPVNSIVKRYHQRGGNTLNTAENGMIQFFIAPEGIKLKTYRQDIWPFWFAN